MTNISGAVVWSATYDAFGKATVDAASTITNNLRFPGQYFDAETNLHYNYNRFYEPESGRYLREDPIGFDGGDVNLYNYVGANPVNYTDPEGMYILGAGVPKVTNPEMDKLLSCLDQCTGKEQYVTATTNGKHSDPGHAAGTSVDIRPTGTSSKKVFCCSSKCGAQYLLDERYTKTKFGTGPHYHIQLRMPSDPKKNSLDPCNKDC